MRAWRFSRAGEPLALVEVAEPAGAPGDVVIDVRAAGLCHSDVGLLEDARFRLAPGAATPLTLGHEVAGVISALGEGVSGWAVGDRVGIALVGSSIPGLSRDGGYSFKVTANADVLVRIPDAVSFEAAAAGTDAGVTAYAAVRRAGGLVPGRRVGIIGLGGLGQIAAKVAVLAGAEVFVADVKDVRSTARKLGVMRTAQDIRAFAGERLETIIDFAGFGVTTAAAIESVGPGGRVVQVGLGRLESTIDTQALVMKQVELVGVLGGEMQDLVTVYDLLASGDLAPTIGSIAFEEIPAGLRRLSEGTVEGRLVASIDG